jgi:hypothetical protein
VQRLSQWRRRGNVRRGGRRCRLVAEKVGYD